MIQEAPLKGEIHINRKRGAERGKEEQRGNENVKEIKSERDIVRDQSKEDIIRKKEKNKQRIYINIHREKERKREKERDIKWETERQS